MQDTGHGGDMEYKQMLAEELLKWAVSKSDGKYTCERADEGGNKALVLTTPYAEGRISITFLEKYTITEYRIRNDKEEDVFYLHFELQNLEHAEELFMEMRECLLKQRESKNRNILLCCTCGLTTSFFTMKLNETAELLGTKMHFSAVPYEMLFENADDKDAILIAPQMGYKFDSINNIYTDKLVMKIPAKIFSSYDVAAMITLLSEEFQKSKEDDKPAQKEDGIFSLKEEAGSLLIVSVINMERRTQIAYRVYDRDTVVTAKQITKERYSFSDIQDVIQTVLVLKPQISAICIVTPGMTNEGRLTYEDAGIFSLDVCGTIKEQFGLDAYLFNDADMIALGYAAKERDMQDSAFYFVPTGDHAGSVGIVANGKLLTTGSHMGGSQLESVTAITTFPKNPFTLARTPEGNIELASRYLTGLYSYTGIPHIAFYSSLITDAEELRKKMTSFIREEYIPEIVKVSSIREYLYDGVLRTAGVRE